MIIIVFLADKSHQFDPFQTTVHCMHHTVWYNNCVTLSRYETALDPYELDREFFQTTVELFS